MKFRNFHSLPDTICIFISSKSARGEHDGAWEKQNVNIPRKISVGKHQGLDLFGTRGSRQEKKIYKRIIKGRKCMCKPKSPRSGQY